ncbi:MAG: hypothetical protein BAA02_09055 [Paenibacillaceae bacterium ZCTH02-B3]|nr:MAG: hypothetical protein BAA02_09055 [Paenibacillaceae bacterium ZCTH02-B3]
MRGKKAKKAVSLLVLLALAAGLFSAFPPMVEASTLSSLAACEAAYDAKFPGKNPPNGIKCVKRAGSNIYLFFNYKLYEDTLAASVQGEELPVIAYGTPEAANGPNDFRTYWQDKNGNKRTDREGIHPYFNRGGQTGEYRYYGWDVNGNLYTNPYFPDDKNSGIDPSMKKYIYRPWSSPLLNGNRNKPSDFGPFWNGTKQIRSIDEIYGKGQRFVEIVNQIIKSSHVTVNYQAKDMVTDPRNPKNLFDYMYVQQAPTSQLPGSGRLFHQSDNGTIWYQTYMIDPLGPGDKEKPGVTAEIKPKMEIKTDLGKLGSTFIWSWELSGKVNDDDYIDDSLLRAQYYTRLDIEKWELEVTYSWPGGSKTEKLSSTQNGDLVLQNQRQRAVRSPDLSIKFDKEILAQNDEVIISLTAKAYYYENPAPDVGTATWRVRFDGTLPEERTEEPPTPPPAGVPEPLICRPNIPGDAFDIVPFPASDGTDLSKVASRTVWVDGVPVDADLFFSGGYVFGDDKDGLVTVSMKWEPIPGVESDGTCDTYRIVNVHDTKPRAQFKLYGGSFKENRKMAVENTSNDPNANDPYVLAHFPLVNAQWSWRAIEGSDTDRRMRIDGRDYKEFLYKKAGEYELILTVTNALGRTSDPYVLRFTVIPDYAPAIILHPYSSQISRTETLRLFYDAVSTDGDIIRNQKVEVFYDVQGNETYTQKIAEFSGPLGEEYTPPGGKLGKYRIRVTVDEDFGQETFPEFITEADRRVSTAEMEFEIDNYIPYSDIYTDIPSIRQQVDVALLLDKNLAQHKIDEVKSSGVELNNRLRYYGMDPNLHIWDLHTYTYSQSASTVVNTGSSYPPATRYHCSNGYCGTLNRVSATDNGYWHDFGHWETVVDVPGHWETVVDVPGHWETRYYQELWCRGYGENGKWYDHPGACTHPTSEPYYRIKEEKVWVPPTYKEVWVDPTYKEVWVSDVRWVSNWYGTYSGTIYKDVRQPYQNPYVRAVADKYLIYVSDGTINELADFNKVKGLSDGKIILIGAPGIRNQTEHDHFIRNQGQDIRTLIDEAFAWIAGQSPPSAAQTVLVGETFQLLTDETDPENDPIVQRQTMYVHHENFYDNPMGRAPFALADYDPSGWSSQTLRNKFDLPGEYIVYRRVKDRPSTDPALQRYTYWSNESFTVIRAHRKPIALAELDWTYNTSCNCYDTTWVDKSYDLDHNISDPENKGIAERKIRYYRAEDGEWYYKIPDRLPPGTYQLEYLVKDVEGAWSDPFVMNFTLQNEPPPQLRAELRADGSAFTIAGGVPAGEKIRAHDLWTRFPYSVDLQFRMNPSGNIINRTVPYHTGTKTGSDIFWADETFVIPQTTADGNYTFRVRAVGANGTSAHKDFTVRVLTPINLQPGVEKDGAPAGTLVVGDPVTLAARTTEYPNQVTVTAFKGTSHQRTVTLSGVTESTAGTGAKRWSGAFTPHAPIPDGTYTFEWTARTPNGNTETKTLELEVINNTPPDGALKVYTYDASDEAMPVYEGDTVRIRAAQLSDRERDNLSLRFELFDQRGAKVLDQTFAAAYPYGEVGPDYRLPSDGSAIGTWTARLSISDGKAPAVVKTRTFLVRTLGVQGYVRHTDEWEANRLRYNEKYPENPRPPDLFWAGEAFVLEADVTDTQNSGTRAVSVTAEAERGLRQSLAPADGSAVRWKGLLRSDENIKLYELPERTYTFVFTATYSNGAVKTSSVTVRLQDTVDEFWSVHRVR